MLVHGEEGTGKSWLGQTTPTPRLVLDAEGGSRSPKRMVDGVVVRQRKITWDPARDEPPADDGTWDTCNVIVRDYHTIEKAYAWLNAGKHPFRSVVLDSLTEIQKRCKDAIAGVETPTERDWGLLLIKMEHLVRGFRDLVFHPSHPLEAVVILALTHEKGGKRRPAIQGALGVSLPGYMDVEGYLFVTVDEEQKETRKLLIVPRDGFAAKDRTHTLSQHFGPAVINPDVEAMLGVLNQEEGN
jgi:hypothetical protein